VKIPELNSADTSRNANISFLFFALGGAVGLINMASATIPFGEGFEMVVLAKNLALHGAYINPFRVLDTGATAANPPMYPFLLSLLVRILRVDSFVVLAATLLNILANAVTAALLPRVSWMFYGDVRPGIAASVLWLLSTALMPSWDTGCTAATLLLFCLFSSKTMGRSSSFLPGLIAGLLAGILFLFNPSTILIFAPWIAYLVFERRVSLRQVTAYCAALVAVLVLMVSSWMFRNYEELGAFVVRTNLGMTLYSSNNDCASSSLIDEERTNCYQSHHPNTSIAEAERLRSLGEIEYDRMRVQDTMAWVRSHRTPFLHLSLARFRDFWLPPREDHPFKSVTIWIATLLSIPGLLLMIYRRERVTPFALFVLAIYPLMYYVVVSDVRYRIPVLWLSLLPAGYFLAKIGERIRESGHGDARRRRFSAPG